MESAAEIWISEKRVRKRRKESCDLKLVREMGIDTHSMRDTH